MGDPLLDTLFRPTTCSPRLASAPPVRAAGTRSRAGNAMARTRAALLAGARRAVEVSGTRITMSQVAAASGVAKATLYNHFRTRDAVLAALLDDEVERLVAAVAGRPLAEALAETATALADHPVVRALAEREPGALSRLATVDPRSAGWRAAHDALGAALGESAGGSVAMILRWLSSYLITPGGAAGIADEVTVLLAALPAPAPADRAADSADRAAVPRSA